MGYPLLRERADASAEEWRGRCGARFRASTCVLGVCVWAWRKISEKKKQKMDCGCTTASVA